MPFVAVSVKIPEYIHHILSNFLKSRTLPARQVQCAKIILLAADSLNNVQILTSCSYRGQIIEKIREESNLYIK